jgi:hypothetical protein
LAAVEGQLPRLHQIRECAKRVTTAVLQVARDRRSGVLDHSYQARLWVDRNPEIGQVLPIGVWLKTRIVGVCNGWRVIRQWQ